jgi:preprotein translocase subunit SecE
VARNRKRAKERRSRRPSGGQPLSRPGVATRPERDTARPEPELSDEQADNGALASAEDLEPEPEEPELPAALEHAAPDVELADAQIALGRAQADELAPGLAGDADYDESQALGDEALEDAAVTEDEASAARPGRAGRELATADPTAPAHQSYPGHRLVNFLQGSWRELQRVQWPDRRQVVQATGVVIGFVIVAGVYLGIADTLATKIVNFLLK